jgi:hypothetical protein
MKDPADKSGGLPPDSPELAVMHERIPLLLSTNEGRTLFLNTLGCIGFQCYRTRHAIDDLHQAICAYDDADRDRPGSATCPTLLGNAALERFVQLGDLVDITKSVALLKKRRLLCCLPPTF